MLPVAVARSSSGGVTKSQGEGQMPGLSEPFKNISNFCCQRSLQNGSLNHQSLLSPRSDSFTPAVPVTVTNNVMKQKGSFSVSGKRK